MEPGGPPGSCMRLNESDRRKKHSAKTWPLVRCCVGLVDRYAHDLCVRWGNQVPLYPIRIFLLHHETWIRNRALSYRVALSPAMSGYEEC